MNGLATDLKGKIALVTGASRGLGAGIARRLASCGADVIVTYRRAREQAEAVADDVRSFGSKAWILPLEMGETEAPPWTWTEEACSPCGAASPAKP